MKKKQKMVEDYLNSGKTMIDILTKYTGRIDDQYQIKRWMHKYGYKNKRTVKNTYIK